MVLEATMICIDNSEWMRNSDFSPSRFEAQQDACNLICGKKVRQNVENVVGLLSTAGRQVEVQVSLTSDMAKMLSALHRVQIGGESDLITSIQVARLALRHRQNKRQEQRIVVFVGSPVAADTKELIRLGGQLKKNKIAVDIVNYGEEDAEANLEKLEAFHKSVNNHDNSSFVTIPPGTSMLSEVLSRTPIVRGVDAPPVGGDGDTGGGAFDWVDPDVDPELAMVLAASLETHEQERKKQTVTETPTSGNGTEATAASPVDDDDDEFQAAMRMSMMEFDGNDDEDFQKALAMSIDQGESKAEGKEKADEAVVEKMEEEGEKKESKEGESEGEGTNVDAACMSQMLLDLPGVDPNDPEMQALLASLASSNEEKDKKEDK